MLHLAQMLADALGDERCRRVGDVDARMAAAHRRPEHHVVREEQPHLGNGLLHLVVADDADAARMEVAMDD